MHWSASACLQLQIHAILCCVFCMHSYAYRLCYTPLHIFRVAQVCWAAEHTLATASGKDSVVRMYNFETEDNYVLQVGNSSGVQGQNARTGCPSV